MNFTFFLSTAHLGPIRDLEVKLHTLYNLALDGTEWSDLRPVPRGKSPVFPLDTLYGFQNRSGHGSRGKLFPLPGTELPTVESVAGRFKDWTVLRNQD